MKLKELDGKKKHDEFFGYWLKTCTDFLKRGKARQSIRENANTY